MSQELSELLSEAQARGACFATTSNRLSKALKIRIRTGEIISPAPHLYADAKHWNSLTITEQTLHRLRGLYDLHPNWVFSHTSAAVLYGMSVSNRLQGDVHLAVSEKDSRQTRNEIHRHLIVERGWSSVEGIPVTSPERTVLDCMRSLNLREGTIIADSALRLGLIDKEELIDYVDYAARRLHGAAQARATAAFADKRSGSGGESLARAIMWELGFAAPELQMELRDPMRWNQRYYVDFAWHLNSGDLVLGELDGGEKYTNQLMNGGSPITKILEERRRESRITIGHASVVRFSPSEAMNLPYFDRLLTSYGVPKDHAPLLDLHEPRPSW